MRQAGEVTYADAHKERTNEGVIEFRSYSDMKHALNKLDGTEINAEILGSLKINHEQAIGSLTLEADQGHDLEEGPEVGVAGTAAVDLEESLKVAPSLGAKVDHVLNQKAGSLDQKANPSPSLIGAPASAFKADLRINRRNLEAGLVLVLFLPKKMGKVIIKLKSRSRSQFCSNSPVPAPPSKARSVSPPPKRASRSHARYRSKSRSRSRSSSRD